MNKDPRSLIITPMITEKGTKIQEQAGGYLFKVRMDANKIEIKNAIQEIFNVHVKKVNTIVNKGKPKNLGRYQGRRSDWKKAIVYLAEGESISEFEVMQ
ncbi:MAG TPA: 50S ribosomal protein L23 [Candidatus Cloacimonetes bacterium]|nr:50S ribosomal protein L23 [Candidatus Cloacimonadota bacterium]HEX37877.1 50S ribosomal protein L23 [Candidatus Cloacimonadota bacterium]